MTCILSTRRTTLIVLRRYVWGSNTRKSGRSIIHRCWNNLSPHRRDSELTFWLLRLLKT